MRWLNSSPVKRTAIAALALGLLSGGAAAQVNSPAPPGNSPQLTWRRIGGTTISRGLAGPSTGPFRAIWYNAQGSVLMAQTASGRILETSDFQHWKLNTSGVIPNPPTYAPSLAPPEAGAPVQSAGARLYAAGQANIYGSDDGGRTWLNLTGFNGKSIIGDSFTSLAVSPSDPKEITAANGHGVWRSLDAGLSWQSLNEDLPNLPVRRLTGRRSALLEDDSEVSLESGIWKPVTTPNREALLLARASRPGLRLSAAADAGGITYSGSAEGRLYSSSDGGGTWIEAPQSAGAPVGRIWIDSERPQTALATAGFRIFRTVNGGLFWDDVTGALPETRVHALTADRSAGVIYAATDRGVFTAALALDSAGPVASAWRPINRNLPVAAAWDIRLNPDNSLTVALDGYGVFETQAPHQSRAVHLVNAADLSDRPAAPGSLLTVLNAGVARAVTGTLPYPVIASSAQNSQLQVPFEAVPGSYQLAMNGVAGRWTVPLNIRSVAPAIFVDTEGAPLILDSASGLVMDTDVAVRAGATVALLATGLGRVTPEWPAGVPAPFEAPPAVTGTVTAFLDGIPAEVVRATLAPGYVGYYIVELHIPAIVNRGATDLRLVMNGEESNRVRLFIEP